MEKELVDFIQNNSPDGGFLQSVYWRKFQESVGRKIYNISETSKDGRPVAFANIITHNLPIAGNYFYLPRGPIIENFKFQIGHTTPFAKGKSLPNFKSPPKADQPLAENPNDKIQKFLNDLISLARENNAGWIRVEPADAETLDLIKDSLQKDIRIEKASVDMQPREILILDISRGEEEILAGMKQKTRYNIKLAEKKGMKIYNSREEKYIDEFCCLVKITAKRDGITAHPEEYYRKMFEVIPSEILKLYVAEYEGKIIVANLVLFFGEMTTYMHGASDNMHRDVMAPYLLQWRQILDAKKAGCEKYDFGGVKTEKLDNSWAGITKFKTGFAPETKPVQFPGCYDIILKPTKYNLYRALQKLKRIF